MYCREKKVSCNRLTPAFLSKVLYYDEECDSRGAILEVLHGRNANNDATTIFSD